ncbi:hypothetical protein [Paraburkholderia caballeronis]|nr:hypothetical protein [Paraburkholderia caballeronis]
MSALAGRALVLASDPASALRIVIEGSASRDDSPQRMPGFRDRLA